MPNRQPKRQILLVEDDLVIARSISRFLVKHGFRVRTCTTPHTGCHRYQAEKFNAVITDIAFDRSRDENGVELMQTIRKQNRRMPIIAISAIPLFYLRKDLDELIFDAFLPKPIVNEELLEKLEKLIS